MRTTVIELVFVLAGAILYGFTLIIASLYSPALSNDGGKGWDT